MRKMLLVVGAGVLLAACAPRSANMVYPSPAVGEVIQQGADKLTATKTITLSEQSDLGQSGTAVLSEENGKVTVTLNMMGGNFTQPQPAHVHVGSCPNPGAVKYPLTNVVNGKSVTTLDVTMDQLMAMPDKLAINVHKSAAESNVYTACGDVK